MCAYAVGNAHTRKQLDVDVAVAAAVFNSANLSAKPVHGRERDFRKTTISAVYAFVLVRPDTHFKQLPDAHNSSAAKCTRVQLAHIHRTHSHTHTGDQLLKECTRNDRHPHQHPEQLRNSIKRKSNAAGQSLTNGSLKRDRKLRRRRDALRLWASVAYC